MKHYLIFFILILTSGRAFLAFSGNVTIPVKTSSSQEISTYSYWFPPHLRGAKAYPVPAKILEFAKKHGAETVYFMDDKIKCDRSLRRGPDIFVNTRATYWDSMILAPWTCQSPAETILQRFLHEVGHVSHNHKGDKAIQSTRMGLVIPKMENIWDSLKGQEGEAWKFCFTIRDEQPTIYKELLKEVEQWYTTHAYEDKNWFDDPDMQWNHWNKKEMNKDVWASVPVWVKQEFASKE